MWSVAAVTGERDSLQGGGVPTQDQDVHDQWGDRPWEDCGLSLGILGGSLSLSSLGLGQVSRALPTPVSLYTL